MESEDEVRTFRDKLGIILTSSGISMFMFAVMALLIWPFLPEVLRAGRSIISIELILISLGFILIRLSLLTVKKESKNSQ